MAHVALETESTLTDRFQTTVPSSVRQALRLGKKDKIKYSSYFVIFYKTPSNEPETRHNCKDFSKCTNF